MRLIEDEGIDGRQQFAEAVLLQRQVGEQQVMIDDDDVGFERRAARRETWQQRANSAQRLPVQFSRVLVTARAADRVSPSSATSARSPLRVAPAQSAMRASSAGRPRQQQLGLRAARWRGAHDTGSWRAP